MNIDMQIGLTKDLAEFVGILVGDGGIYKNKKGGSVIEVYSGEDDFDYMEN